MCVRWMMRKDGYRKRQKPDWNFFFLRETEKNEDDEEKKHEWKIEAKKKRTRKKIKSPYDAIYTQLVCVMYLTEGFQCALTH